MAGRGWVKSLFPSPVSFLEPIARMCVQWGLAFLANIKCTEQTFDCSVSPVVAPRDDIPARGQSPYRDQVGCGAQTSCQQTATASSHCDAGCNRCAHYVEALQAARQMWKDRATGLGEDLVQATSSLTMVVKRNQQEMAEIRSQHATSECDLKLRITQLEAESLANQTLIERLKTQLEFKQRYQAEPAETDFQTGEIRSVHEFPPATGENWLSPRGDSWAPNPERELSFPGAQGHLPTRGSQPQVGPYRSPTQTVSPGQGDPTSDHDLGRIAKRIPRFNPESPGIPDVANYLNDVKFFMRQVQNPTMSDIIYVIKASSTRSVSNLLARQPARVMADFDLLKQAMVREYSFPYIDHGLVAALKVSQQEHEPPHLYYRRLLEAFYGNVNKPEMEEDIHFKTLFLSNLHPSVSKVIHKVMWVDPEQMSIVELRGIVKRGFEVVKEQRATAIYKPQKNQAVVATGVYKDCPRDSRPTGRYSPRCQRNQQNYPHSSARGQVVSLDDHREAYKKKSPESDISFDSHQRTVGHSRPLPANKRQNRDIKHDYLLFQKGSTPGWESFPVT